jgi:hypothetical protein
MKIKLSPLVPQTVPMPSSFPVTPDSLLALHMKTKRVSISDDDHGFFMILIYSLDRAAQHN